MIKGSTNFQSPSSRLPLCLMLLLLAHSSTTPNQLNNTSAIIIIVNLQRIQTQLSLAQKSLEKGDNYMAFAHAYIPHSVIFPTIKNLLEQTDNGFSAKRIESSLTDLPFMIKSGSSSDIMSHNIMEAKNLLDSISDRTIEPAIKSNRTPIMLQAIAFLLRDAGKSFELSNASVSNKRQFSQVDYEN